MDPDELMKQGRYEEAIKEYEKLIESGAADATTYNNIGVALDSIGRHKDAVEYYLKAIDLDPEYATAYYNLANSLVYLRKYEDALFYYERALTLDPGLVEAYIDLAYLYLLINDLAMMRKTLRYVVENYGTNPDLIYSAALVFIDAGEFRTARDLLEYVLKIKNDDRYWNALGNAYFAMGEYDKALECYDTALEINPENEEVWNNRGFTLFTNGRIEDAISHYKKAIELNSNYRQAWYNLAYAYHAAGKLNDAVRCYWMALKLDPMDEVTWNNMGNALYNLKRYMVSIPYFMKAVTINPEYEIAWNNIGNALDRMHMHQYSIPFHDKALALNKKFDYAWHAKGHALCALGKYEESLEYLDRALELNADYGETWYWRGKALYHLSDYEDAIDSLRKAVDLEPELFEAWELMGDIYSKLGYETEAYRCYNEALKQCDVDDAARIYLKMGEIENALDFAESSLKAALLFKLGKYDEILKMDEDDENVKYYRCLSYEMQGKFEKALAEIEGLSDEKFRIEREFLRFVIGDSNKPPEYPYDTEFSLRIGYILLDRGMWDKAERIFKKFKTPESYYLLGETYLRKKDIKTAAKYFEISAGMGFEEALIKLEEVKNGEKVSSEQKEDKRDKKESGAAD